MQLVGAKIEEHKEVNEEVSTTIRIKAFDKKKRQELIVSPAAGGRDGSSLGISTITNSMSNASNLSPLQSFIDEFSAKGMSRQELIDMPPGLQLPVPKSWDARRHTDQ